MSKKNNQGKGCLSASIALLLIIVIITAFVVVALNLTPAKLGMADIALIEGKTATDLGMENSKIKEVIQLILEKITNKG